MSVEAPFIVFEGPEGAGKSVQSRLLAEWLTTRGYEVVQTREPGGTTTGDEIRRILLASDHLDLKRESEVLLLAASRAQLVRELILPSLLAGKAVICDRFVDSTYAYQGGGSGFPMRILKPIQEFATGGLEPDVRILLDLPVEIGLARRHDDSAQVNRIDRAPVAFHERVRQAFLGLADAHPDGWAVVDATDDVATVAEKVQTLIEQRVLAR